MGRVEKLTTMIDLEFAKSLIDKGLISKRAYHRGCEIAESITMRIGSMAYQRGLLSYGDIVSIIDYQIEHDMLFGEAAAQLGLLKKADVDDLLEEQRRLRVSVYDILCRMGVIDRQQLKEEYKFFLKAQVKREADRLDL